jgi:hypothetical protein
MRVRTIAVTLLVLILAGTLVAYASCDYYARCPMHDINSTATGQTKYTNGGAHMWAEYHCPGLQSEAPHNFWVECE